MRNSTSERLDEASFVPIGGLDQWVTIRGDDRGNPVLLHVHGGPGVAFSAFTDEFAPYEKDFTVVQWDQRGSGCTFGRYGEATPEVTLDRIARDGVALAEYLEDHLGSRKVIVFGHSLGSIVATEMVRRASGMFAAYVGTGQFASFEGTVEAQLIYLRRVAEETNDAKLVAELDALSALDPQGLEQFFAIIQLLNSHLSADDAAWNQRMQSRPPLIMTAEELANWQAGRQASAGWLMPQVGEVDLFSTALRLEIPYIVIQGSDDIFTPTDTAIAYFEQVDAPSKELVIVEGAGHFPHLTHTDQFLSALVRTARPFAFR
jgi:pimeloyl-ACP methyl ester carboxylesterase